MRSRHLVTLLVSLGMVAAACGAEKSDAGAEQVEPESTDVAGETATPSTSADAPTTSTSAPLEATWDGVTSDTIRIGVVWSDLDELREMGLVDINYGDIPLIWQTLIDDINARGGVLGRNLEMVFDQYNPVLPTSVDEMCLRLTEDHEVFAVVGSLAGPALDGILCIIENHETIMVGGTHRPDLLARARAPWISTEWNQERRYSALLELYDREGMLDGRLGLFDDHREHQGLTTDIVLPTLERLGKDIVTEITSTATGGDELALEAEVGLFAEKLRTDGVDTLLIVQTAIALGLPMIREAGYDGTVLTVDGGSYLAGIGGFDERDPTIYEGAYGPTLFGTDDVWAMDSTKECVATFTDANPDIEVIPSEQVADGEPAWASVILPACRLLQVFTMIAESAGPELNPTTFEQAAFAIGSFELPGQPFNSLSPDKLDANDGMGLGIFDPTIGAFGGLRELLPYISVAAN